MFCFTLKGGGGGGSVSFVCRERVGRDSGDGMFPWFAFALNICMGLFLSLSGGRLLYDRFILFFSFFCRGAWGVGTKFFFFCFLFVDEVRPSR